MKDSRLALVLALTLAALVGLEAAPRLAAQEDKPSEAKPEAPADPKPQDEGESAAPDAKKEAKPEVEIIENSIGMKLARIPAGEFLMGSKNEYGRWAHEHQHRVSLSKPFWIGVHEVTQAQFRKVTGENPSFFQEGGERAERVKDIDTSRFPVDSVTYSEALEFCRLLSELPEEKEAGRVYVLPTEAQWEYACRAGTTTPFHHGEWLSSELANFDGNHPYLTRDEVHAGVDPVTRKGPYLQRPTTVGSYPPNAWGLHDMHGNVREWCADWFSPVYYQSSPEADPTGPTEGTLRSARGGDWYYFGAACRSAQRFEVEPEKRNHRNGFRVVCEMAKE